MPPRPLLPLVLPACFLLAAINLLLVSNAHADVIWENHFNDEDPITSGLNLFADNTNISFTSTVFSDSDGGTFDLVAVRSSNFISYEQGLAGNQSGNLEMSFDNQNNDPADYVELQMNFSAAVTNLSFSLLDIDSSSSGRWDDGVEIFFNGINIRTDPSLYALGAAIIEDNESYMDGFEGRGVPSASNQTLGNLDLKFGAQEINSITIRYFSTDDAVNNPTSQFIAIGDLTFTPTNAVPEPSHLSLCMAGLVCLTTRRRRT